MTRYYLDEGTASRWSDAELTSYINQGLRQVQSQIQAANEDYFIRVEVATAVSGSYQLAFPSDIWGNKIRGVWFYDNVTAVGGKPYRLEPAPVESVYSQMYISGIPCMYTYHAGFIRWAPVSQNNGTFRFIYSMKENALVNGVDVLAQIADEHTDCISLYAGIIARDKVGAPTQELKAIYATRMQQITNDVQPTDPVTTPQWNIDMQTTRYGLR
jgi:hypothetical protein